jgi:hypothetical protein
VTWHVVDGDVECLHVERNPTMTCSGSHLYKFDTRKTHACEERRVSVDPRGVNAKSVIDPGMKHP